jgi:hypothetical protein
MHQKIYICNFILKSLLHVSALLETEDEAQGTFALDYINATIVYQHYSP